MLKSHIYKTIIFKSGEDINGYIIMIKKSTISSPLPAPPPQPHSMLFHFKSTHFLGAKHNATEQPNINNNNNFLIFFFNLYCAIYMTG